MCIKISYEESDWTFNNKDKSSNVMQILNTKNVKKN